MARYLIAVHHPDNYDPAASEDAAMHHDIDVLNDEMVAAGVRLFVGGLHRAREAKSITTGSDGQVSVADGPRLKTDEHMGGFWVVEAVDMDEAVEWGRKATIACRTPIEVREFH